MGQKGAPKYRLIFHRKDEKALEGLDGNQAGSAGRNFVLGKLYWTQNPFGHCQNGRANELLSVANPPQPEDSILGWQKVRNHHHSKNRKKRKRVRIKQEGNTCPKGTPKAKQTLNTPLNWLLWKGLKSQPSIIWIMQDHDAAKLHFTICCKSEVSKQRNT